MEKKYFKDFDTAKIWKHSPYCEEEYENEPPTPEMIEKVEKTLGYKLPASYIELMYTQNGGGLVYCYSYSKEAFEAGFPAGCITNASGIFGIGEEKRYSLLGYFGSRFWIEHWEYPDIGIAICDTESGGHDMFFLDYRKCGPQGEPEVVWIDPEGSDRMEDGSYRIYFVAKDFETFIKSLCTEEQFVAQYGSPWPDLED